MRKMKILMLGWELPPHNSGGLGVACYQLCKSLAHKGADIEFILPIKGAYDAEFMKVHSTFNVNFDELRLGAYESLKYVNPFSDKGYFSYEEAVVRLTSFMEFDIIHAHDWLSFRAALRVKEATGKPLITHIHSLERDRSGNNYGNPLVREIEYLVMHLSDKVIAVSEKTKRDIIEDYFIPEDKIEVVHNSINPCDLTQDNTENAYKYFTALKGHGYKVVTNVGRLTIQKGLPNLLYAAKLVLERAPKTIFLIVGDGEQLFELIELGARLGISKSVLFAGFQRGKNWRDAFSVSDLFVMPSISEPFGLTPLEATGYNTPSLISKQSGVAEVLRNCLKVDYWDINEMANQITSIVLNDSLGLTLVENAKSELNNLSWSKTADKVFEVYNQLVGAPK